MYPVLNARLLFTEKVELMLSCLISKSETATGKVEFEYTGFYTSGGERIDAFIYV